MKIQCPHCERPFDSDQCRGLCPACLARTIEESARNEESALPLQIGQTFCGFEIVGLLGRGGMGVVYKARQPKLDRWVAIKILPLELAEQPGIRERFEREAKLLASISHSNIVAVYDSGIEANLAYFVMEYVDGVSLRTLLDRREVTLEAALGILTQLCDALEHAHGLGIVHRDIKPENLLIDPQGRLKVTDFGLAKLARAIDPKISRPDLAMGTPHYMAPEQSERPQEVDHRADIFAVGVIFYEMLTGELPIGKFEPPSRKGRIDDRLDAVVLKALEKSPSMRYRHASEIKRAVTQISKQPNAKSPLSIRPLSLGLFLSAITIIGLGAFLWSYFRSERHQFEALHLRSDLEQARVRLKNLEQSSTAEDGSYKEAVKTYDAMEARLARLERREPKRYAGDPIPLTPAEVIRVTQTKPRLREWPEPEQKEAEDSILHPLMWLLRHQNEDGSWSVTGYPNRCLKPEACFPNPGTDAYDTGVTALSLLAFFGAGYSHKSEERVQGWDMGKATREGISYLLRSQDPSGHIGPQDAARHLLNHIVGALALIQASGSGNSNAFREPAARAFDALVKAQRPDGGWGELPDRSDALCTGWALVACLAAESNKLVGDLKAFERGYRWLSDCRDPNTGRVGYLGRGQDAAILPGEPTTSLRPPTLTALLLVIEGILMARKDKRITRESMKPGIDLLMDGLPQLERSERRDMHHLFWASLAVFHYDGPSGSNWKQWNEKLKRMVLDPQNKSRTTCRHGTMEPFDRWSALGGRVYMTAMSCMTQEVYYRYPSVFQWGLARQGD